MPPLTYSAGAKISASSAKAALAPMAWSGPRIASRAMPNITVRSEAVAARA